MRPNRRSCLTAILTLAAVSAVTVTGWAGPAAAAVPAPGGGTAGPVTPGGTAGPVTAGGTAGPVPVTPAVPTGLPQGIEDLATYVPQVSCDPVAKPGATALARLLVATYPGTTTGIARSCGLDTSEHYEGRAIDWMVSVRKPAEAAQAQAVIDWLFAPDDRGRKFANARRLGVMYVIWNDRIWGAYASDAGWRPYSTCAARPEPGSDTACHRNHVHLSLSWAGATARTSFWSGQVAATDYGPCRPADLNWAPAYTAPNPRPCPKYPVTPAPANAPASAATLFRYSGTALAPGSTGPAVSAVQAVLGVTADGEFGPDTQAAVSTFRAAHGLPAGGAVDAATWRALLSAAVTLVKAGRTADGPAPVASGSAASGSAASGSAASGSVASGSAASGSSTGTRGGYAGTVLRYGARGPAVVALQRALLVSPASGWFGPVTLAAVTRFQQLHRLPVTGVADAATWAVLG